MDGVINVYKPAGMTSYDVIRFLKRTFRPEVKIGHAGTLDPLAEGVLLVCLGQATRLTQSLMLLEKEYVACLLLGVETDTLDREGKILAQRPVTVSPEKLKEIILSFQGEIKQVPPSVSALKYQGLPLYKHHRQGRVIVPPARTVFVKEIEILRIDLPEVEFRVLCSRGTYIRSLCRDIGEAAGCGGIQISLLRRRIGPFRIEESFSLPEIEKKGIDSVLMGLPEVIAHLKTA